MLGKLRRLGLLVPSSDSVTEMDFKTYLPREVSFHTARLSHSDSTKRGSATLDEICDGIEPAAPTLVQVSPEVIVFACTSGSFHRGEGWDREVQKRITDSSGVPAIVTGIAVADALRALQARRIFMVTPYPEEINQLEIAYFARHDVQIVDYTYFHCEKSRDVSDILPETILARILEHGQAIAKCDALFISCTGLRGMEVIAKVEEEIGVGVVSSNSANIFAALRFMGIDTSAIPAGRLFRTTPLQFTSAEA